ncbi:hypothetical protein [Micromonospora cathayae]|uniref:Uncharacterized protein n=1 Tax=Micromonospora cathayae TaxID=3028804 RepID=A0ABY7ZXL9_9ACTN|nr:hypothetical protein [Micromonospora sp. HUAS 3]WDZ87816.1 hypothetical protein PVK37_16110 [Micromonospora sp. HUAS 3]
MRLHEIDTHLLDGVREIVDVTHEQVRLRRHLRAPEEVAYRRADLDAPDGPLGAGVLALALTGPNPPGHTDPSALVPLLGRLAPGARLLLLLGWPVAAIPYHRLLDPLGAARCQVVTAAPLDRVAIRGVHAALVVERVTSVTTPRPYLSPEDHSPRESADHTTALLRMANEYVLGDLVTRPARRRLAELDDRVAALTRELAERDEALRAAERDLAGARARLAALESPSASALGRLVLGRTGRAGAGLRRVLERRRR